MSGKSDRRDAAQAHLSMIRADYATTIERGISSSRIYEPGQLSKLILPPPRHEVTKVKVLERDTVSAVMKAPDGKLTVLNFASYCNPGGGFSNGALAQEESLCSESILYPVLANFTRSFYEPNRKATNRSLYTSRSIYSDEIVFMRNGQERTVAVITAAAPNRGTAMKNGVSAAECSLVLRTRIRDIFTMAAVNGTDILVLGAFGCGVFKNDPSETARFFTNWLDENPGHFSEVVFAIPPEGPNLRAFEDVFQENSCIWKD